MPIRYMAVFLRKDIIIVARNLKGGLESRGIFAEGAGTMFHGMGDSTERELRISF